MTNLSNRKKNSYSIRLQISLQSFFFVGYGPKNEIQYDL